MYYVKIRKILFIITFSINAVLFLSCELCASKNGVEVFRDYKFQEFYTYYEQGKFSTAHKIGNELYADLSTQRKNESSVTEGLAIGHIIKNEPELLLFYPLLLPFDIANVLDFRGIPRNKMIKNPYFGLDRYISKREQRDFFYIMGILSLENNKKEEAYYFFKKFVEVEEQFRLTLNIESKRVGYILNYENVIALLVDLAFELEKPKEGLMYIELGKARTMCDILHSERIVQKFRNDIRKVNLERASVEKTLQKDEFTRDDIHKIERSIAVVGKMIQRDSISSSFVLKNINHGIFDFKNFEIEENTAALNYYYANNTIYTLIIDNKGIQNFSKTIIDSDELDVLTGKLSMAIFENNQQEIRRYGKELYKICIDPLDFPLIHYEKLIISPHGPLHSIPFYALFNNQFLVESNVISYTFSFNMYNIIKELHTRKTRHAKKILLVGAPDFQKNNLPHLPYAEKEIHEIKKLLKGKIQTKLLSGSEATKEKVVQCKECDIIHFATHSFFDTIKPEESYIALAGYGRESTLLASDLYEVHFKNGLTLVVMSSCESGKSTLRGGDDAYGLIRSWFIAGAKRVVSTFWDVADEEAFSVMVRFYENFITTNLSDPHTSLQKAIISEIDIGNFNALAFKIDGIME